MKRLMLTLLAAAVILGVCGSFARAFTMAEKVVVANELVAIARVPAGGFTAQQRIDRVNERLAYILGYEALSPRDIYAVPAPGGSRAIMVGDSLLITVTPRDAFANDATVVGLTRTWLQLAKEALPQARPTPGVPG